MKITEYQIKKQLNIRSISDTMKDRQYRLQCLVDEHGIKFVALAAGFTESTLRQYLRNRNPTIGGDAVIQAEEIFAAIS